MEFELRFAKHCLLYETSKGVRAVIASYSFALVLGELSVSQKSFDRKKCVEFTYGEELLNLTLCLEKALNFFKHNENFDSFVLSAVKKVKGKFANSTDAKLFQILNCEEVPVVEAHNLRDAVFLLQNIRKVFLFITPCGFLNYSQLHDFFHEQAQKFCDISDFKKELCKGNMDIIKCFLRESSFESEEDKLSFFCYLKDHGPFLASYLHLSALDFSLKLKFKQQKNGKETSSADEREGTQTD